MKKLTVILYLLLAAGFSASAQNALYVVDGKVSNANIKSTDILTINILDSARAVAQYGRNFKNGVTVIISKQYAVQQYQQKFSALNKKYKDYLDQKHNDSNLSYVLNNVFMNTDRKSSIQALYDLAPSDIDKVIFKKDSHFTTDATVLISTKNN